MTTAVELPFLGITKLWDCNYIKFSKQLTIRIWLLNFNQFHDLTYKVRLIVTVKCTYTSASTERFCFTLSDHMDLWHTDMLHITALPASLSSRMRWILVSSVKFSYKSSLIKRKILTLWGHRIFLYSYIMRQTARRKKVHWNRKKILM